MSTKETGFRSFMFPTLYWVQVGLFKSELKKHSSAVRYITR